METVKVYELKCVAVNEHPAEYKLTTPQGVVEMMRKEYNGRECTLERFYTIALNNANIPIGLYCIAVGSFTNCLADRKLIFKFLCELGASACILVHNHPTGTLKASQQDITTTRLINDGLKLLDIRLLDHIILTPESWLSMMDSNLI